MADPVAVIGFAFKLPGGIEDESGLWELLTSGRNVMTEWPEDRLNIDSVYDNGSRKPNTLYARGGHFVTGDPAAFDAPFFSIMGKEAVGMDVQHRWALEASYHAFENAGITMQSLKESRTSVYAASMTNDYSRNQLKDGDNAPLMVATGSGSSILANRLSWYYNLTGPSIHVDTACSGGLVALDLACQSLREGSSNMALVVATNFMMGPDTSMALANMNFLSPDSVCWSFDSRANGYGRGEGVIALLVKPLARALQDGDSIRAVIRGIGANQDGRTAGLTNPSSKAQERLIREVYARAGLGPEDTCYVEAHGTGTPSGDPIEMRALGSVFKSYHSREDPLYVGSIKANIGHLEAASGLAGVLKCIMVLERGIIPKNALFEKVNPNIDLESLRTEIPLRNLAWPKEGLRRVSINSFGFGGTNCHIIMDDARHYLQNSPTMARYQLPTPPHLPGEICDPICESQNISKHIIKVIPEDYITHPQPKRRASRPEEHPYMLLVLSAATENVLHHMIRSFIEYLDDYVLGDDAKLESVAYTLSARRSHLPWRAFMTLPPRNTLERPTLSFSQPVRMVSNPNCAFIFTGQGSSYESSSLELMKYPRFRETLKLCQETFDRLGCKWCLIDEINDVKNTRLPEYSQPICTAMQIAIIDLLESFGIVPSRVIGHSSGEIAAAYSLGALSLESACKIAYYRGKLAGQLREEAPGAMLSVALSCEDIPRYLEQFHGAPWRDDISIACINSPKNCTLSGPHAAIEEIASQLVSDGTFALKLDTGVAYHSKSMEIIAGEYLKMLATLHCGIRGKSTTQMVSTVTGRIEPLEVFTSASYWVRNLVSPVLFTDAVAFLASEANPSVSGSPRITDFIEIGPRTGLRRPVLDTLEGSKELSNSSIQYHSVLLRAKPPQQTLGELTGKLFSRGHQICVQAVNDKASGSSRLPHRTLAIDIPSYPFDHSHLYWSESRLSRDFRIRGEVTGAQFLGRRSHDWNPLEPRWRNFLSIERMPWLADHIISGKAVFPAAGMLVMAMEALNQISSSRRVRSYFVKEATFMRPIVVGDSADDPTETMLRLKQIKRKFEKSAVWSEITISAYRADQWTECFQALIQQQYEDSTEQIDNKREKQAEDRIVVAKHQEALAKWTDYMDASAFYEVCDDVDHHYGESFQLLQDLRIDDSKTAAIALINVSNPSSRHKDGLPHPAVLDAMIQLAVAPISKTVKYTLIPRKLSNMWISADGWTNSTTSNLGLLSKTVYQQGWLHIDCEASVLSNDETVLCIMPQLELAYLAPNKSQARHARPAQLLHSVVWKPSLKLLSQQEKRKISKNRAHSYNESDISKDHAQINGSLVSSLSFVLRSMSVEQLKDAPVGLRKYIAAMQCHVATTWKDKDMNFTNNQDVSSALCDLEEKFPQYALFPLVLRHMRQIILGNVDPVELIFSSGLLDSVYQSMFGPICDERFQRFLELATHENPTMKIIEIGAGTGAVSRITLDHIAKVEKQDGTSLFSQYVYTDISPAFFERARVEFQELGDRMIFQALDINHDIERQGFSLGDYDIVICGSVIHAAANVEYSLRNLRKLLKPGGRLVNLEMVAPKTPSLDIIFGLLPAWWAASEDWRSQGPLLTECQWDDVTRRSGFTGNDLVIRDFEDKAINGASFIITAPSEDPAPLRLNDDHLLIIIDNKSEKQKAMAELIARGRSASIADVDNHVISDLSANTIVVFLLEVDLKYLATMSPGDFETIQAILLAVKRAIWFSSSYYRDDSSSFHGMMVGLFRSLRSEAAEKRLVTLHVQTDDTEFEIDRNVEHLNHVLSNSFNADSIDFEFLVRDGTIHVARLVEEKAIMAGISEIIHPQLKTESWLPGPSLKLGLREPGALDSLQFIEDTVMSSHAQLEPHDVEIEAKAWALSFRDLFIALARLEGEELGFECTGVVTRVGEACKDGAVKPGDRVCLTSLGSMRTYPRAPASAVTKLPDDVSFELGVSAIAPGVTVYYALVDLVRLKYGETILIHSGAGGTGQMAIHVAMMLGAEVFVTVGNSEKKSMLINMGVPEDHIFFSRNTSFAKGIKRATQGRGVDVVLNSLSGEGLEASWQCVAPFGRFVEIGKTDVMANSSLPMSGFARNVSFFTVDLHHMIQERPQIVTSTTKALLDLLFKGKLKYPAPIHVYSAPHVEDAFRYMQSGKNTGRIVIRVERDDVVTKFTRSPIDWSFEPDASYLIVGGLGGVGRSIASWMVGRGVKSLILPSRTGPKTQDAIDFIKELSQSGVNVIAPECDVSSAESLARLFDECSSTMAPIKGCINAAMVLQDATFQNMEHTQWHATIASKVHTSWNLHKLLPDLDFFVLLSSMSGILGAIGQSNYAAGCTFQDSLAQYRMSRGQKSLSIDIGWMRTVGVVAKSQAYDKYRRNVRDMIPLETEELLALLGVFCSPQYAHNHNSKSQVLLGAVTPAQFLSRGEAPIDIIQRPLFRTFARAPEKSNQQDNGLAQDTSILVKFQEAGSAVERAAAVAEGLSIKIARALAVAVVDIQVEKTLIDYGVDSLVAVEIRNWIGKVFKATVAVFDIMGEKSINEISQLVVERAVLGPSS
ncbi:fatty acid synthase S-acetyltransferase [Xylaria intraflava]|nr:fatty acid synthase S-acetyltransferase [Xylaria intraflava]